MTRQWGFLRETEEKAIKAGLDPDTGVCRTGLDEYLKVIFKDTNDWVHDKGLPKELKSRRRPDYRSESLKLIVEFDGLLHYTSPENIQSDLESIKLYESIGYKIVRIPYFIQLTNSAVEKLFGVKVNEPLFDVNIPSLGIKNKNTPAYLCVAGVERMAKEFTMFPDQYKTNLDTLIKENNDSLTGVSYLIGSFNKFSKKEIDNYGC